MHVVCIRMLLSASICLSTLQKHEGVFVLILKSAWGILSTLYYWAWGVLSAFQKTWWFLSTYTTMDVGCFVRGVFCPTLDIVIIGSGMKAFTVPCPVTQTRNFIYLSKFVKILILLLQKVLVCWSKPAKFHSD